MENFKQALKKVTAILMIAVLLVGIVPLGNLADVDWSEFSLTAGAYFVGGETENGYSYYISDGEAQIYGYNGIGGDIIIPSELGECPVTTILFDAFYGNDNITSIIIPDSIISIQAWAFGGCDNLTSVTIGCNVKSIEYQAFAHCGQLENIEIPDTVSYIDREVFYNTAYYNNETNWENNVLFIGNHLIDAKDEFFGAYKIKTGTITVAGGAFYDCTSLTSITIPDSVTIIGDGAFEGCYSLASVTIPDSVISIGDSAFRFCTSLASITIPDSVTSIGDSAYRYCTSLTSITIPDSITSIGNFAFCECTSLASVTIGSSVTSIGRYAFENCSSLKNIEIPNRVNSIDDFAFTGCNGLTSVKIPDSVTNIGVGAFYDNYRLTEIVVDENNVYYSNDEYGVLFDKYKTILVQYPVGNMGDYYEIPDSVTTIGNYAFADCSNLKDMMVPANVTVIGERAFYYCEGLRNIYYSGDNEKWNLITVGEDNDYLNDSNLHYNVSSVETHYYTEYFTPATCTTSGEEGLKCACGYTKYIYIPATGHIDDNKDMICEICNENIYNYEINNNQVTITSYEGTAEEIVIPSEIDGYSVTSIGEYAFYDCTSLTSVTIPDSVTSIGDWAFEDCDSLESVTVDENNQYFSSDEYGVLFNKDKTNLIQYPIGNSRTEYKIPDGVTSIGRYAFYECTSLASVTIPDSVTSIGRNAFAYTAYYKDSSNWENNVLYIGNHLIEANDEISGNYAIKSGTKTIADEAFGDCYSLESVTIPDSVESIGDEAFAWCESLTSVTIPDSVTSIGWASFYDCDSLESVTVDENNQYYSSDEYGVLFNKDKTNLIQYPIGNSRTEYIIPDSVTSIGRNAFGDCYSLESITIPDSVTSIGNYAFDDCRSLESITIPDSVTSIGDDAFAWCESLTDVYYLGSENDWNEINIGWDNDCLTNATIRFNSTMPDTPDVPETPEHTHTFTTKTTKPATCTATGVMTYNCSCGDSYTESIAKTGHKEVNLNAVAATCTNTGLTQGKKCSVCGTITIAQRTVAKTAHKEVTLNAKVATYTVTGLTAGKKCSVCGTVTVKQTMIPKLTLGKVSGLKAKKVKVAKSSEITLTWNKVTGAEKYEIYQQNGKSWKKIKTTSSTSYTVKKLSANKSYKFKVRAVVDSVKGKYSSVLTVKTVPATTSKLTLKAGSKQLTASWKSVSDISGYEVQYSTSSKMKNAKTVKVKKSSKKTTIKKLTKGKKYYVRVRAYTTVNGKKVYSSWSTVKNVKVK